MKLICRLTLLLTVLLFLVSCSDEDYDRAPVLELSEKSADFSKTADTKSITVKTNEGDEYLYAVIDNSTTDSWIELTKGKTELKISVTANTELVARTAMVKVMLVKGSLEEMITVTQQANDELKYTVSQDQLNFSYDEESTVVYVETNTKESWTISENSVGGWLTIDLSEQDKGKFIVKTMPNSEIDGREAEIKVTFPGKELTVAVFQRGVIHFDFPLLNIGFNYGEDGGKVGFKYPNSFSESVAYETKRGSTWKSSGPATLEYTTKSAVFPTVVYSRHSYLITTYNTVKLVIARCPLIKPFELLKDLRFQKYLSDSGFEFSYQNEAREIAVYWNEDTGVAVQFCNYDLPAGFGNRLTFIYTQARPDDEDNQVNSYQTLESVPAPFTEWGADAEAIAEWESKTGSTLLEGSTPSLQMYTPDKTKEPNVLERAYYLNTKNTPATLFNVDIVFNRVDLAFYSNGYYLESKAYIMTREFKSLMTNEGFAFIGSQASQNVLHNYYVNLVKEINIDAFVETYQAEELIPRFTMTLSEQIP